MSTKDLASIKGYHAHLYYDERRIEHARHLREEVQRIFSIPVGTFHEKLVGPHPVWSCELAVPTELFGQVIPWLVLNRGDVDVFVHPETGNDLRDHTEYVMWLGKTYELKTDIFR